MIDDYTPSGARRRHRLTQRRRRRLVVSGALMFVVVVVFALLATDTLRPPRGSGPRLAGRANALDSNGARLTDSALPPARKLSPTEPLGLWIAGDSLAGSLGPSLGELAAATGVVQPVYDSRVSSGLTTADFFDWPGHAGQEIARLQPEAIVFMIGTNDANLEADTPTWKADYSRRVENMLSVLVGNPARAVYWVGAPVMRDPTLSKHVRDVNEIARQVIANHPEVTYVDSYSLFSDTDGGYASSLPDASGEKVLMRAGDGIHFTPEGGDRLAQSVFKLLDGRWNIGAQAVPSAAKTVIETKGSTQVPGTSRNLGSHRRVTSPSFGTTSTTATTSAPTGTGPSTPETTSAPTSTTATSTAVPSTSTSGTTKAPTPP